MTDFSFKRPSASQQIMPTAKMLLW